MEKLNTNIVEELNELMNHDSIMYRKNIVTNTKGKKIHVYFSYNQGCTCVVRIRETIKYINSLELKKENQFGQAFNFYEFVNCCSIVFECINTLFEMFGKNLESVYGKSKIFVKSNKTREGDIKFFKFVRSASAVHPEHTSRYKKITKLTHEFYPYAVWNTDRALFFLRDDAPNDFDIGLTSWNSKPSCYNKEYYLYLNEFYEFLNKVISCLQFLIPVVTQIIQDYKEKRRCKRLKPEDSFKTKSEYCIYLRNRLLKKNANKEEFADGGLLVASHILSNKLLKNDFKKAILKNVRKLSEQMMIDLDGISFDDVYNAYDLFNGIDSSNCDNCAYVSEKFSYLEKEAIKEIENNSFGNFWYSARHEDNNLDYSNAEWAANLLLTRVVDFYKLEEIKEAKSFADLFEITLQTVWAKLIEKSKGEVQNGKTK